MKKNILAMGIAAAIAAPIAMADAPTIYGQFNVAVENNEVGNAKGTNAASRNSRLGFKGAEDLGNGMKAVYQFETTINVGGGNNANGGFGGMRNTFVGVAGGFGTVVLGRHDTPLRMIQPSDGFADNAYAGNNTSRFNGGLAGEDRLDEVVAYLNTFGDISVAAALSGQANLAEPTKDQAVNNAMSFSVAYGKKSSGIYLAAAMTSTDKSTSSSSTTTADATTGVVTTTTTNTVAERGDIIRLVAQYNANGLVGSFMYNDQDTVGNAMTLGVSYKMGQITPRAKIAMVDLDSGADGMNMAVGADYSLGKKTRVYAEFASLDKDLADTTALSVGLFHKF